MSDRKEDLELLLESLRTYINATTAWGNLYDENDIIIEALVTLATEEVPGVKDIVNRYANEGLFLSAPHFPGIVIRDVARYIQSKIEPGMEMK